MYIRSSDEEPLIQQAQQTFVRRGAFRVSTRRPSRNKLKAHQVTEHQQAPENPVNNTVNNSCTRSIPSDESRPLPLHPPLTRTDRVKCLPPLPPSRTHDEISQRLSHDVVRKPPPLHYKNDPQAQESIPHTQNQKPPSPSPSSTKDFSHIHELSKSSHPYVPRTQTQSFQTPHVLQDSGVPITKETASLPHQNTADNHKSLDHRQSRESWNQRLFSALRRPPSPSPVHKKLPPPTSDIARQSYSLNQSNEIRRGIPTIFKRSSSPAVFYRNLTPTEDKGSHDAYKSLHSHAKSTSLPHGRSSPPVHSLTPQASPLTYHRVYSVSDPPPDGHFKRHGSFPLHRKPSYNTTFYVPSQSKDKDPDPDQKKCTGSISFRRPTTPVMAVTGLENTSSEESCTGKRIPVFQKGGTNCFALLPTSRPSHLSEGKNFDPETVSIPVQLDPRYDKKDFTRRRTTEIAHVTPRPVPGADSEGRMHNQSKRELLRAHSLPATRREIDSKSQVIINRYPEYLQQDTKDGRSHSLNAPVYRTSKNAGILYQEEDRTDGGQVSCISPVSPVQENPGQKLIRSSGSIKSQDSYTSIASYNSYRGYEATYTTNSPTVDHRKLQCELSRSSSTCSSVTGPDIYECFDNILCGSDENTKKSHSNVDHIAYLLSNDEDYISCIANMLTMYDQMCIETPPHIRQHFDVLFKQLGLLHQFHIVHHSALKEAGTDLITISDVFKDEQFQCYRPYMIMTPTVQKDFYRYSAYFEEHFPSLKRDFLKPSVRLNFYSMLLDSLKKSASEHEKLMLQSAVEYLSNLKRQANTEMTITSVVNSPVDLRLCGDMLMIGDIFCYGAGPLQKRKYHMILFETILMVASSKTSSFKYKIHYRIEQLEEVKSVADDTNEFNLKVLTEGQVSSVNFKFKVRLQTTRDQWVTELQKIISQTKLQFSRNVIQSALPTVQRSQLLPLSLYKVYPQLFQVITEGETSSAQTRPFSPENFIHQLISQERAYIKQISSLLNPEILEPPESVCTLLGKFYHLHKKQILPQLERAQHRGFQEVLTCILDHLHLFQIYADYFVVRCQLNAKLEKSTEASLYISPVQHFTSYMHWLRCVSQNTTYRNKAALAFQRLKDLVLDAQVRLLSESIIHGRIDFYRSGNLLRSDTMEVKTRRRGVHEGMYQVLLFEKIIILTKPKPPFYEYVWDIWLNQANLGPPSNSERGFKLEVRQGRGKEAVTFEFRASDVNTQQIWIHKLQQELIHQAEDIRKRASVYNL